MSTGPQRPSRGLRSRMLGPAAFVVLALAVGLLSLAAVAVRGANRPVSQAEQAEQIAAGLRCPVCQDLSAAESPAPLARQMRQEIAERLAAGDSPTAIQNRFVAAYGETVLLTPPHSGPAQLAYALPLLALIGGLAGGAVTLRAWRHRSVQPAAAPTPLAEEDRSRVDTALNHWLEEDSR
ncbi:MAG TPA: cytochrome c-type biogenesis protein CcmH [Streptomyces sp.]